MNSPTWAEQALREIETRGLRRFPETIEAFNGPVAQIGGNEILVMCSNNYLGLAEDPRVKGAAGRAVEQWGAGSGASRLVSGTTALHRKLEDAIATWKGCEDSMLFSSGYLANVGVIPVLAEEGDAIFSDELNHASIVDGCRLSKAQRLTFRHLDYEELEQQLSQTKARRRLILSDSIFSMDGDVADLGRLVELRDTYDAMLMVDEAHATGMLGPLGAGAISAVGLGGQVDVVMGTLSKAVGSAGGFVAGAYGLIELLRNRARTYIFDTAPPPAAIGAALEAIQVIQTEPERATRTLDSAIRMSEELLALGFNTVAPKAAIVPLFAGDAEQALDLSQRLLTLGVLCPAIRPPSVPADTCRLRVTVTAGHSAKHIDQAIAAFETLSGARANSLSR